MTASTRYLPAIVLPRSPDICDGTSVRVRTLVRRRLRGHDVRGRRRYGVPHDEDRVRERVRRHGHEREDVIHAPFAAYDHLDPRVVRADGDRDVLVEADGARRALL